MRPTFYVLLFFFLGIFSLVKAQGILFSQNHDNGVYHKGDRARVFLTMKDKSPQVVTLKIQHNFSTYTTEQKNYSGDSLLVFDQIVSEPTTLVWEARTKTDSGWIGLIVNPESYEPGTNRPADLESFWDKQKKELHALPFQLLSKVVPNTDPAFQCLDIEINGTSAKPARGYFAKPTNAAKKSLPIVIYFHSAGVVGEWCKSKPEIALRYARMGKGALVFDLNAHGMLNGQPQSYYDSLDKGELFRYAQIGISNKNESYFLGMYQRLLRTIDYMASLPEWDGKRILVIGESQGGGQSLVAVGLDKRVTAAVVSVPAMCDWGGTLVGRKGSWPYLFDNKLDRSVLEANLPYFDAAHLLKGSTATIVAEIGLIDQTCPSSALFAALNQTKGKKVILTSPYRAHHFTQTAYKEIWEANVNKQKLHFVEDYLK
jgi:cephalosporin-C deacetylase-like acetyl esterase